LIRKGSGRFLAALPLETEVVSVKPDQTVRANEGLAPKLRETLKSYLAENCGDISVDSGFTDEVYALDANRALVGLVCSTGAYNITTGFWIVNPADVSKAVPVRFDAPETTPGNTLVNADFDPSTGAIKFFRKDRGLGDCGAAGKYVWTGSTFVLASYAAMTPCRGIPSQDWPILRRAKVL
jgi:hypothetical protein